MSHERTGVETIDYEALLRDRGATIHDIDQRKNINRLKDIASNLETLEKLKAAEAKAREQAAKRVEPGVTPEEGSQALVER